MDYIFRRLALDHLPFEQRSELGILTAAERTRAAGRGGAGRRRPRSIDPVELAQSAPVEKVPPAAAPAPEAAAAAARGRRCPGRTARRS